MTATYTEVRQAIWRQWDRQEEERLRNKALVEKRMKQTQAYIRLNNLYLNVERGVLKLNVHIANELRICAGQAYDRDDVMIDWWEEEFTKLPGWLDV